MHEVRDETSVLLSVLPILLSYDAFLNNFINCPGYDMSAVALDFSFQKLSELFWIYGQLPRFWGVREPSLLPRCDLSCAKPGPFNPRHYNHELWGWKVQGWSLGLKSSGLRCPSTHSWASLGWRWGRVRQFLQLPQKQLFQLPTLPK